MTIYHIHNTAKVRELLLIASFLSARPSVRIQQFASHWTDFDENFIFEYFSIICREISIFIKIEQE
jgi:hypothetical protein